MDSSVTALLLKKQGFNVIAVFMKNWSQGPFCNVKEDQKDARSVATKLKIPFYTLNFEQEYKRKVLAPFIAGIKAGITPNPDVLCNEYIKFGVFLNKALKLGADFVATGHYARIKQSVTELPTYHLLKGVDETKDQSYFLYRLNQFKLSKTI
ncbi:MAG: tRNA 2-thiouridine(34) synthase MnmA, partial [Patescibacteria group bacterium]